MAYNFSNFQQKLKETQDWLSREMGNIRTGRASMSFLDGVKVESYGTTMNLNGVAALSIEDAKTIRIAPWDHSQTQAIEKAIVAADLGVSVTVDDKGLRVIFPELTGDRRLQLVKVAKEKLEESKIALRHERNTVSEDLNDMKKSGAMGEDDVMRAKADMEKVAQEGAKKLEEIFEKKEKEITA